MLKRLNLNDDARDVLVEATRAEPCHWGAWLELSGHISERGELTTLGLPDHWMKHFFLAHTYLELQLNEAALETYFGLQMGGEPGQGLHDSTYILAQVAIGECLFTSFIHDHSYFKITVRVRHLLIHNVTMKNDLDVTLTVDIG